ncbi:hypothetical protein MASR1M60_32380 [Rhodocyclaceae bacterium]
MEADLGTRLEWVAVDHWNTDNPHTHVVSRGKDDTGKDLIISPRLHRQGGGCATGRRNWRSNGWGRAPSWRSSAMQREVNQERWTDWIAPAARSRGWSGAAGEAGCTPAATPATNATGRLQHLQRMGLATEQQPGTWAIHSEAEATSLRAMGERGDIIRTMQRAMGGLQRELAVFQPAKEGRIIVGRVVGKGLADELHDKSYLVIDGTDGKAHYVVLPPRSELEQYPAGAVV